MKVFICACAIALLTMSLSVSAKSVTVKFSIVHGVEGRWYRASAEWQQSVQPLIERSSEQSGR